jgi:hypothetical protein
MPLTEEQLGRCGMAVDFIFALISRSELKTRSYLAAGDRRGVAELRRSAQISADPTRWTMGRCAFTGDTGYRDVQLHLSDRQQVVRILLRREGAEWRVAGIEPAPSP